MEINIEKPFVPYKKRFDPTTDIVISIVILIGLLLYRWKYEPDIPFSAGACIFGFTMIVYAISIYYYKYIPAQYSIVHIYTKETKFHIMSRYRDEPIIDNSYKYMNVSVKFRASSRAGNAVLIFDLKGNNAAENKTLYAIIDGKYGDYEWDEDEAKEFIGKLKTWQKEKLGGS